MRQLTVAQCEDFSALASRFAGLNLRSDKLDFFDQRLGRRVSSLQLSTYQQYLSLLRSPRGTQEIPFFIEALTTHTTSFFREPNHFDFLDKTGWQQLLSLERRPPRRLTVWSAACSTGAELYTAMISATQYCERTGNRATLSGHGTDISRSVLRRAQSGLFVQSEIEGLGEAHRRRFLLRHKTDETLFRVDPQLRKLTSWSKANLTELGGDGPAEVDLIFLRNVLIYFERATQDRVVASLANRIAPGGFLFTGHSETLSNPPGDFRTIRPSIYQKVQ